jgi:hypothetical protein
MKNLILLISLIWATAYAGTCTGISRTNYTTSQVLTSSSLNTNLNTVYSAVNALDAGCLTDGTLEKGALNSTEFDPILKAPQTGCSISYSSANTVIISKCSAAVDDNYVSKSTTTNVTMGCSNCSADSASTTYYLYISAASSGTTITGLILTTVPNADGYDNSGNRVLARFYNNSSSDIDQYSIDQWHINRFIPTNWPAQAYTPTGTWIANSTYTGFWERKGQHMHGQVKIALAGAPTAAALEFNIPSGYAINSGEILDTNFYIVGDGIVADAGSQNYIVFVRYADSNSLDVYAMPTGNSCCG